MTSMDDPFGTGEMIGGVQQPRRPDAPPVAEPTPDASAPAAPVPAVGMNPLLAVANRLLLLVPHLRQTRHADPATVRLAMAQGIREVQAAAESQGIAPARVMAMRYVLCTLLDEVATETPWGGSGAWAGHSLLAEFHNEVSGGERVYQLMAHLAEQPEANRDLLELIFVALCLGFQGRYRLLDNGRAQLEAIRAKLAQLIRQHRPAPAPELAQRWQVQATVAPTARSWLPLAATATAALLLLAVVYAWLVFSLNRHTDPVQARIQGLKLLAPAPLVVLPAAQARFASLLQPEMAQGLVTVREDVDRSVIALRGDGLFAPAGATLTDERKALLQRLAQVLAAQGGELLVTGHTDNTPIRSLRFPSNWHLSTARAHAVRDLFLAAGVPPTRVRAEGRADGEPAVPNDTPAQRAQNRRVEITLFVPPPSPVVSAGTPAAR
jgi:type VI secretion system protein ImpK